MCVFVCVCMRVCVFDERLACIPPDRAEQVTCEGVSMRACACECVCMRAHACGRTMLVVMALYCALQI